MVGGAAKKESEKFCLPYEFKMKFNELWLKRSRYGIEMQLSRLVWSMEYLYEGFKQKQ